MHPLYDLDSDLSRIQVLSKTCFTTSQIEKLDSIRLLVAACHAGNQAARQELVDLGILRKKGRPQGDYGEWLAKTWFNLSLAPNKNQPAWDAIDSLGKTVSVKARFWNTNTSFDNLKLSKPEFIFDYLIGILFWSKETFQLRGVVYAPYSVVRDLSVEDKEKPGHWRLRWSKKNEKQLVKLYWDPSDTES